MFNSYEFIIIAKNILVKINVKIMDMGKNIMVVIVGSSARVSSKKL
jgi:hypothetical protein